MSNQTLDEVVNKIIEGLPIDAIIRIRIYRIYMGVIAEAITEKHQYKLPGDTLVVLATIERLNEILSFSEVWNADDEAENAHTAYGKATTDDSERIKARDARRAEFDRIVGTTEDDEDA